MSVILGANGDRPVLDDPGAGTFFPPSARRIRLEDPRFRWLLKEVEHFFSRGAELQHLLDHLKSAGNPLIHLRLIERLRDYVEALQEESLEGELFGITTAAAHEQDEPPLIARELQWDGQPSEEATPYSAFSASTKVLISDVSSQFVWAPVLDRALDAVASAAPLNAADVGGLLKTIGLTESDTFTALGLINAQDIFRRKTGLRLTPDGVVYIQGSEPTPKPPTARVVTVTPPPVSAQTKAEPKKSEELESPSVREEVRAEFARLQRNAGLVRADDLLAQLRSQGKTYLNEARMRGVISRIDGLTYVNAAWIADVGDSSLTRWMRKIVSACPRVPVDIAWIQLGRENQLYRHISPLVIEDCMRAHPEFRVENHRISTIDDTLLVPAEVMDPTEYLVFDALRRSGTLLRRGGISSAIVGGHRLTPVERSIVLRNSCVIVPVGEERFASLGPSGTVLGHVRQRNQEYLAKYETMGDIPVPDEVANTSPVQDEAPVVESEEVLEQPAIEEAIPRVADLVAAPEWSFAGEQPEHGRTITVLLTVRELLDDVERDRLRLPEIQRGYVWKSGQVRDLIDSLYRGYPVGTMLVWRTAEKPASRAVGALSLSSGDLQSRTTAYLLDGQQRLTSMMRAIVTGETHIVFNVSSESFRVTAARATKAISAVSLTELFRHGAEHVLKNREQSFLPDQAPVYLSRLKRLEGILERVVPVETLEGYSYEEVTEVFIRVNSRGTRLKTAELAIADVAYRLPGMVSEEIEAFAERLAARGWDFPVQFLLRLVAGIATGHVGFRNLGAITDKEFTDAWRKLPVALDTWLDLLRDRISLMNGNVLAGTSNHVVPVIWFARSGDRRYDAQLLEWFVHSAAWGRYTGRTESNLDQDIRELLNARRGSPFAPLLDRVRQSRSTLRVALRDVEGAGQNSPLLLLMYLAMVRATRDDLLTDLVLPMTEMDSAPRTTPHLIFSGPSVRNAQSRTSAAQLANVALLTAESAGYAGSSDLSRYFEFIPAARLDAFAIPADSSLWQASRFAPFVAQRARLLVQGMNAVINDLGSGRFGTDTSVQTTVPTVSPVRMKQGQVGFDELRQEMFDRIAEQIMELHPGIVRHDRTTYLGFRLPTQSQPFVTVARLRRTSLSWVLNCNILRLRDPNRWCRDVAKASKYGYGDTQFNIESESQIPYAMDLIRQAYELNS